MKTAIKLVALALLALCAMLGFMDPALAAVFVFLGDVEPSNIKELNEAWKKGIQALNDAIKRSQDTADSALDEVKREGTLHKETSDKITLMSTTAQAIQAEVKKITDRMLEVEQKITAKPAADEAKRIKTAGEIFAESDQYKNMLKSKDYKSGPVEIERKTIINAPLNNDQPLVAPDRLPGIIMPALRRLTIRDLLPQITTGSNLIEFASELVFTNNAKPQGAGSSPTETEGQVKNQSDITFQLSSAPVITLAHWIAASRQVMSDAQQLAGYINSRLQYGLKLEEENELLNSTGTAGELNGLRGQSAVFTGGATNQTALDTLLKAFLQVSLSFYESSGVILHPTDWTSIMMLKDTLGRYLFSDPHSAEAPRVWGKPVVATQAIPQGQFLTGAFDIGAAIYDREGVSIRVSDQHSDFFARNLVAILCEERLAFVMYRASAFVTGGLNYAG